MESARRDLDDVPHASAPDPAGAQRPSAPPFVASPDNSDADAHRVQFSSWIGWFPVLFFSTTWIAEIYAHAQGEPDFATAPTLVRDLGTRAGTRALFLHSLVALTTSIVVPSLVATTGETPYLRQPSSEQSLFARVAHFLPTLPFAWLNLPLLWTISNGVFSVLLLSTWFAGDSVARASFLIAAMGFCWAVTNWAPFALVRPHLNRFHQSNVI